MLHIVLGDKIKHQHCMKGQLFKQLLWSLCDESFCNYTKGPSINVMSVQTIHFLRLPPKKEYTSTFFECKKTGKKVKSVWKKCWFSQTPLPPPSPKVYGLYTCEHIDIYGHLWTVKYSIYVLNIFLFSKGNALKSLTNIVEWIVIGPI